MKVKKLLICLVILTGICITNCSGGTISYKDQGEIESVLKEYYNDSKKVKTDYNKKYELIYKEDKYFLNKNALIQKWAHDLYHIEFISIKKYEKRGPFVKININAKIRPVFGDEHTAVFPVYLAKQSGKWKIRYQNDDIILFELFPDRI
jgi:hypothetical protein